MTPLTDMRNEIGKIFEGLKVVEWGNLVSAPYCAKLFADLGAEVIKVEKPCVGDEARQHGPFPEDIPNRENSGLFLSLNTNKLGITLNAETEKGRNILKRLLNDTDVFVENNPPQVMAELGLDYNSLSRINSRLIMASITPFGQTGPYRDYKAYELNCSAAGGVLVGVGYPDREPLKLPSSQGSYQAGASAATAVVIALLARKRIGEGQHIDISEAEVWANLHVGAYVLTFLYRGITGIRRGTHGGYFRYPNEILPCKDGYIALNCPQLEQWTRFLDLLGNPEWTQNPRYRDRRAMHEKYPDEVNALLVPWLKEHTMEELFQICLKRRIPLVPIYHINDLVDHPHLKQRNFFVELDHSEAGRLRYPLGPCQFSKTNWKMERSAPLLGQHNELIFCQRLQYSSQELAELTAEGVI